MRYSVAAFLLCIFSVAALAQTTVPYTFTAGTTAQASQVNADFSALATAIDNLTSRVSKLEGQLTAADMVGTYAITGLSVTVSSQAQVTNNSVQGTLNLNANGTYSLSISGGIAFSLNWIFVGSNPVQSASAPYQTITPPLYNESGTWSLSGNTLSLNPSGGGGGSVVVTAGGRLFVTSSATSPGTTTLNIFIRSN
jgi:hypothetical protein